MIKTSLLLTLIFCFLFLVTAVSAAEIESTDFEPSGQGKILRLKQVIEEGLRKNPDERIRQYNFSLIELKWQDKFEEFWYPNTALTIQNDNQRLYRLKSGGNDQTDSTTKSPHA